MKHEFLLYGHGGCENHGCEAIIRSTVDILKQEYGDLDIVLSKQDYSLGLDGEINLPVDKIILQDKITKLSLSYIISGISYVVTKKTDVYFNNVYRKLNKFLETKTPISLSIGGDNYCYGQHNSLYYLDKKLRKKGCKKVLWGCSIEPDTLDDKALLEDLDNFDLIIARESITVNALQKCLKKARVELHPDPAFALKPRFEYFPESFTKNGIIGINISPTVGNVINEVDVTYENYDKLLEFILTQTNYNVVLIPHVTWAKTNDLVPLTKLFDKYNKSQRIRLVESNDCRILKGYISQCDMFIGARTHATIAAYSSCVPCVVVGYSVKADGIAVDLFGTKDNYVISSQTLENDTTLINAFKWLDENKLNIKKHLEEIMPKYIKQAYDAARKIKEIENKCGGKDE